MIGVKTSVMLEGDVQVTADVNEFGAVIVRCTDELGGQLWLMGKPHDMHRLVTALGLQVSRAVQEADDAARPHPEIGPRGETGQ